MNHFEQNFASIFGPESHRREQLVKAEQAEKNQQQGDRYVEKT